MRCGGMAEDAGHAVGLDRSGPIVRMDVRGNARTEQQKRAGEQAPEDSFHGLQYSE